MTQGVNEADSGTRICDNTVQVPRGVWSFYPVTNKCNRATRAETSARNEQHDASCNTRSASLAVSTQTDHKTTFYLPITPRLLDLPATGVTAPGPVRPGQARWGKYSTANATRN